jgi:hypothetical protein
MHKTEIYRTLAKVGFSDGLHRLSAQAGGMSAYRTETVVALQYFDGDQKSVHFPELPYMIP